MNARSECVAPADASLGGVVEIMRMFHAACPASQRPAARPTRGSGLGAVTDTIGVTGAGITAGGGGGGVGRAPALPLLPPRAPSAGGDVVFPGSRCCCGSCAEMSDVKPNVRANSANIRFADFIRIPPLN